MKEFKTISYYQIIKSAYYGVLDKWINEKEKLETAHSIAFKEICNEKISKYRSQLDELHDEILNCELLELLEKRA